MIDFHNDFSEVHTQSKQYFALPREYFESIGAANWTDNIAGLAFARAESKTRFNEVIAYEHVAQFLEGFGSQRSLLPFGAMAHWIMRLAFPANDGGQFDRLRRAFVACDENWRTAGALAGMLSGQLPAAAYLPAVETVCTRLRDKAFPMNWFSGLFNGRVIAGEIPTLSAEKFEAFIRAELKEVSDADLKSWLKFGRGPMRHAGRSLTVEPPPRAWGEIVDELLLRPRLAGSRPHIDQMMTTLSVPPRRQAPQALPLGGYADVVTHGSFDRLLPSQHALDDLEFLRRFSENELLFFRREEPPTPTRHKLVVILDQGVRTWGDVRLVLTAATLALAQRAEARLVEFRLACTSTPDLLDPRAMLVELFGQLLEASDLSRDPGLVLERVLETPETTPRDIFLLTHPYALSEPDVAAAARRLASGDRLFAMTVNAGGSAELVEMRHGLPVRLKLFQVDFDPAVVPELRTSPSNWSGPVEPYGWPFRFVPPGPVDRFDFDESGKRVLAVLHDGMLCVWETKTGKSELLPRPMIDGAIAKNWKSLIGVADGFALLMRGDIGWIVVHYDMVKRQCSVLPVPMGGASPRGDAVLMYLGRRHTLLVYHASRDESLGAIDLHTKVWESLKAPAATTRTTFWESLNRGPIQRRLPATASRADVGADRTRNYHMNPMNGAFTVSDGGTFAAEDDKAIGIKLWPTFVPHTQGQASYVKDRRDILDVQLAGATLGILARGSVHRMETTLLALHRGPDGGFLREIPFSNDSSTAKFMLSSDGAQVAMVADSKSFTVQATDAPQRLIHANLGHFGAGTRLWVGDQAFLVSCGRHGNSWHMAEWLNGFVVFSENHRGRNLAAATFKNPAFKRFIDQHDPVESVVGVGADLLDEHRYRSGVRRGQACFLLDQYGQILVFDRDGRLMFQFYAYGDTWTAWLPDGTRCGRGMVHHWPNVPGAASAVGNALRTATRGRP